MFSVVVLGIMPKDEEWIDIHVPGDKVTKIAHFRGLALIMMSQQYSSLRSACEATQLIERLLLSCEHVLFPHSSPSFLRRDVLARRFLTRVRIHLHEGVHEADTSHCYCDVATLCLVFLLRNLYD